MNSEGALEIPDLLLGVDKCIEWMERHLDFTKEARDKYGEVFTPHLIVKNMVDPLPESFWRNPKNKVLDPATGFGQFPVYIYHKFYLGLADVISDERERHKHIIQNMIYMIEIQGKSVNIIKRIFGSECNILQCSFVGKSGDYPSEGVFLKSEKCMFKDKTDKFDLIVGNPPYNKRGTTKGGGVFWKEFILNKSKGFYLTDLLNYRGFISLIHPTGWKKPIGEHSSAGDVFENYKKTGSILYLNNNNNLIKHFPTIDYYVFQKDVFNRKTIIDTGIHKKIRMNISSLSFIPNILTGPSLRILNKILKKRGRLLSFIYNQNVKSGVPEQTDKTIPYTHMYDVGAGQYRYWYPDRTHEEYVYKPKIIVTYKSGKQTGHLYPKYFTKPTGNTNNTIYYLVQKEDNPETIVSWLKSEIITFIFLVSQYSEGNNRINEYKILNKIPFPVEDSIDLEGFYGLTRQEIKYIKSLTCSQLSLKRDRVLDRENPRE